MLVGLNKPSRRDYNSVRNFFDKEAPVVYKEVYINRKEDLITLKHARNEALLESAVEKVVPLLSRGMRRVGISNITSNRVSANDSKLLLSSSGLSKKTDETTGIILLKRGKFNTVISVIRSLIITTIIIALLIAPIYPLWKLSRGTATTRSISMTMMVLLVFTFVFSAIMTLFTRAERHEVIASAAA